MLWAYAMLLPRGVARESERSHRRRRLAQACETSEEQVDENGPRFLPDNDNGMCFQLLTIAWERKTNTTYVSLTAAGQDPAAESGEEGADGAKCKKGKLRGMASDPLRSSGTPRAKRRF